MAKTERKSNPFGWIVVGALIGAVAVAGVLLMASSMNADRADETQSAAIGEANDKAAAPAVVQPTAAAVAPAPPPAAVPAPPPTLAQPSVDAQMADDAAAAGMTSRAPAEPQPAN